MERMKKDAASIVVGTGGTVNLSLAIDATKVAKFLELSYSHKAIIGGALSNHVFDIS